MSEEKEISPQKLKLAIGLAAGFCIIMLALVLGSLAAGSRTRHEPAADTAVAPATRISPVAGENLAPGPQSSSLVTPPATPGKPDLTNIEIMRHKDENAEAFHQYLRDYARENPDADDALSEEQIKKLEKVGAIAM